MKKFTLKGVLDGFRSSVGSGGGSVVSKDQEIVDNLRSDAFQAATTIRLGFPHQPTAMAYDPIQKLLAIGTKTGGLRILGRPGVNVHARHTFAADPPGPGPGGTTATNEQGNGQGNSLSTNGPAVLFIQFVGNEGLVVTATSDDTLHLWSLKQKRPEIIHSLKFTKERVSRMLLPFGSKWLYVGTEKGNVHIVNVETFDLSAYVIHWNKAIGLTRSTHPGAVVHLSDCPTDSSKLLVGFENGLLTLWDLRTKTVDCRFTGSDGLRSSCWLSDGKQFVSSYADGSITTWSVKNSSRSSPGSTVFPHAKIKTDGKLEPCKSILKVEWMSCSSGEPYLIFSGGLPQDRPGRSPCLTVINGRSTTVLEMEQNIIDFIALTEVPWASEFQDPHSIIVLLQNDLIIVDLLTPGFPCLTNPYPMDLHTSRITCIEYFINAPSDLIPALYSVGGVSSKRTGFSERGWPITGGKEGTLVPPYCEVLVTGHEDGTLKFWDTSSVTLQILYKMKITKNFEKWKSKSSTDSGSCGDIEPFAVTHVAICPESKMLAVAITSNNVILCKFRKIESTGDLNVIEVPVVCDSPDIGSSFHSDFDLVKKQNGRGQTEENNCKQVGFLRPKTGPLRKTPGYQAELITLRTGNIEGENTRPLTALAINTAYGLLAYGHERGLVVIDFIQRTVLLNMTTSELYSSTDPFNRLPRSPKRSNELSGDEKCKSPTFDYLVSSNPTVNKGSTENELNHNGKEAVEQFDDFEVIEVPEKQEDKPKKKHSSKNSELKRKFTIIDLKLKEIWNSSTDQKEGPGSISMRSVPLETGGMTTSQSTNFGEKQELPKPFRRTQTDPLNKQHCTKLPTASPPTESNPVPPPRRSGSFPVRPKDLALEKNIDRRKKGTTGHQFIIQDLRDDDDSNESSSIFKGLAKKFNKFDSALLRSRSSSISSLDGPGFEAITSITFADTCARKQDPSINSTVWAGTAQGSVLAVVINFPAPGEPRLTQPLMVSPSGTIFRLKGSIHSVAFLDASGSLVPPPWEFWKDDGKSKTPTRNPGISQNSPSQSQDSSNGDSTYCVLVSEKQARVLALPSQTCISRATFCSTEQGFVIRSDIVSFKDGCAIAAFASTGRIVVHSLPLLRPLLDVEFLPLGDLRFQTSRTSVIDPIVSIWAQQMIVNEDTEQIARTFRFGDQGHGVFLCSPTEIEKFTLSSELTSNLPEMVCDLYSPREMPEPPKEGFLKGLFGGGVRNLDREELFGEASGKAYRGVARHVGPSANIDALNSRATGIAAEVAKTRQNLLERGEKLGLLEEKTEMMRSEAEAFGNSAHQLMVKYRDRKWYQL